MCQMDDILVFRSNQAEHNARLVAVMECLEAAEVTLNPDQCEFGKRIELYWAHSRSGGNSTRPTEDIRYCRDGDTSQQPIFAYLWA